MHTVGYTKYIKVYLDIYSSEVIFDDNMKFCPEFFFNNLNMCY